jgi:hypothetical protein
MHKKDGRKEFKQYALHNTKPDRIRRLGCLHQDCLKYGVDTFE